MVRWLISFFLLSITYSAFSQSDTTSFRLSGVVVDSLTNQAIPDAYVVTPRAGTMSKGNGSFAITVREGETVSFTHVAYYTVCIRAQRETTDSLITVVMQQKVRVLRAITVSDILSEEGIKARILETEKIISCDEQAALDNSRVINSVGRIAPLEAPTREERFFKQLLGPQDVTILSSNMNSGIFGLIRSLSHPQQPRIYRPTTRYRSDPSKITPFKVREHLLDSARRDSAEVVFNR